MDKSIVDAICDPESELLTIQDAAFYLRVSASFVKNLIRDGVLDGYRLGKRNYVEKSQLDAYIQGSKFSNKKKAVQGGKNHD